MELGYTTIFSTSFIIAFSGALMLGPLLTVTVSESPRRGVMTGPLIIFGHTILELALIIALLSGVAPFLMRDDSFIVISLTGSSVLLWMGTSMLRSLPSAGINSGDESQPTTNLIWAGIVLSAVNPYWLVWWTSIGIGYIIHSQKLGLLGIIAFFGGHILADLLWYTVVSFSFNPDFSPGEVAVDSRCESMGYSCLCTLIQH